jgi:ADP-heptose:LPS heptosyltransferase
VKRILIIRLGALGDFVQSFGPFAAIRAHHPEARITLLTTRPFAALAERAPWFDAVLVDTRPAWWNAMGLLRLSRVLREFDFVYDLQTSARSSRYFRLAGRPRGSGMPSGCSHPHANPRRDAMHTRERQREQLEMAGITAFPPPALDWLSDRPVVALPHRAVLLVPGAAPHRPRKRWPAERFGALAARLARSGRAPVVIGTRAEASFAATIRAACPSALDLTGRTEIADLAGLAARASLAVGNDTGPMHLAAAIGCPCLVLFSAESDPALTAPRGPDGSWPKLLRVDDLATLTVDRVADALA